MQKIDVLVRILSEVSGQQRETIRKIFLGAEQKMTEKQRSNLHEEMTPIEAEAFYKKQMEHKSGILGWLVDGVVKTLNEP